MFHQHCDLAVITSPYYVSHVTLSHVEAFAAEPLKMENIKYLSPDSSALSVSDSAVTYSASCLSRSNIHTAYIQIESAVCIIVISATEDFLIMLSWK